MMSMKKSYLKSKPVCKVTFRLTTEQAQGATRVQLIGDFNDWNESVAPMKRLKNGDFTQTVNLETDKDYEFRYLLDNTTWENDWHADAYVPNGVATEDNSVVKV